MSENNFALGELHLIRNNLSWNECFVVNIENIAMAYELLVKGA